MRYRAAKRDLLRALTSEMLPYEVPIPFDITRLYEFLRWIKFRWTGDHKFTVLKSRLGDGERSWLGIIFDPINLGTGKTVEDGRTIEFNLADGGKKHSHLRHPYKFRSRRNNGKSRELSVPHPHSMVQMASFIHEHRDSILYYTNRSQFSIRHPHRVARLQAKTGSVFEGYRDREQFGFEQSDLEYAHVSSYFSYRRYNNINRFYSSPEFQACERKYPHLMRADVSKCFDSIYTHSISWVTNGVRTSKRLRNKTGKTFGGQFDHLMQYLNYAETSGIIIGPELSRIFAEIILQEIDIRIERDLASNGLTLGTHYEIMRYVDDYFVFLADPRHAELVEEILARQLASFKLHLNEQKQRHFDTPLQSHMSVAKIKIREALEQRTQYDYDPDNNHANATLYFSSRKAILDYKSLLIDTGLEHGELANSYLYELGRRRDSTVRKFRKRLNDVAEAGEPKAIHSARLLLIRYLMAVLDVAIFIYSGAPSVSHSVKLTRLVAASLGELEIDGFGTLERLQFSDKVAKEIVAQLNASHDETSFGAHTLLLLDCLIFVNPEVSEETLTSFLTRRGKTVNDLDAFGVLTLLRRFQDPGSASALKQDLLTRAGALIDLGRDQQEFETARAILMLSLPTFPGATPKEIAKAMGNGVSESKIQKLRRTRREPSVFSWHASDSYYERLLLKSTQFVY
ncbi:RNA-directed DNA polymerase [Brevibacterium antiquum]|uniref:antiviral reverse transcriptase Drt3b n=1 Tax=Brevibacterium antiquum TaxID=234835 RepID=UPI0018DF73A0|nr:antiviral reverse transcriptase Drt3b [Brevibacterium antiquum]